MNEGRKLSAAAATSTIVFACVLFDVALHRLAGRVFHFNYFDNGLPPSILVRSGIFPVVASLGFASMFGFLALTYSRARLELGAGPLRAGQRFFAPIAFVMFFGVLESAVVFPTPFKPELVTALADAVPYILLGVLLGLSARRRPDVVTGQQRRFAPWQSAPGIGLVYVVGRYLVSYPILHICSGYIERPAGTFAWTAGSGLSMGAFYWLAGSVFPATSPARRALRVGLTLGTFWLMVQLFLALMFSVSVSDLVLRGVADTAYLFCGIYAFERLFRREASPLRCRLQMPRHSI